MVVDILVVTIGVVIADAIFAALKWLVTEPARRRRQRRLAAAFQRVWEHPRRIYVEQEGTRIERR